MCIDSTTPATPSTKNARTVSGAGARTASAPERNSSTPRNAEATMARSAVRSVGGRSSSASLEVAGNVPHSAAISSSATYARV